MTYWNEHVERRMDPDVSKRPMECTACPGDALFVPHGWWHMVLNIGSDDEDDEHCNEDDVAKLNDPLRGVSIALTRNYVSASNLPDVLRFLDTKISQISGCRDRKEAVQPEELGRELRSALMAVSGEDHIGDDDDDKDRVCFDEKKCDDNDGNPEKEDSRNGRWADLLERSELRSKNGWSCNAWTDLSVTTSTNNDGSNVATVNQSFDSTVAKKRRIGSSVLTKAKQMSTNATHDAAANASGFSFSFFS